MNEPKPTTMPAWAQQAIITTYRTSPAPRWVACSQCGGTGLLRGSVGGYEMMCSCVMCMGGGGRFEP